MQHYHLEEDMTHSVCMEKTRHDIQFAQVYHDNVLQALYKDMISVCVSLLLLGNN